MTKKIIKDIVSDVLRDNFLGCKSEYDLYNKLFEKSKFVFPEYEVRARKGISKHTANLIASGIYSGDSFVTFSAAKNTRVFYHLKKLAEKGFVSRASGRIKTKMKFNLDKIKTGWLEVNHQKTDSEFEKEAIERIDKSMKKIKDEIQTLIGNKGILTILSDTASSLEILSADLENFKFSHEK